MAQSTDSLDATSTVRWPVKAFVWAHVIAITIWALPTPPQQILKGSPKGTDWILVANEQHLKTQEPLRAYLICTGFAQYWDMFAPNPLQQDFYCTADIAFENGLNKQYSYPRMATLSIPEKFLEERYRKAFERVKEADIHQLWPDFAQRLALVNATDLRNLPVRVRLHRHSKDISPPSVPQPGTYIDKVFYDYAVDLPRLRHDLGAR